MTPALLTLISSILIVLAFPPWGAFPLIWIALVPWFMSLQKTKTIKAAFLQGLLLSFLMSVLGFFWVSYVLHDFANLPWPVAVVGLFGYGLIGQPQFYLFAPLWKWLHPRLSSKDRHPLLGSFCFAFLYSGIDWIIPKLFVDTLGHSLWSAERLRQASDIGGAALLTFVVYWVNDAVWRIWENRKHLASTRRSWLSQAIIAFSLFSGLLIYGEFRKNQIQAIVAAAPRSIQVGVIQANIGDWDKIASETGAQGAADRILDKFFEMSDEALKQTPKPDVLVWPETSYPHTFRTPETITELRHDQRVEKYVRDRNIPLLFGGYDHLDTKDYNAFFFLSPRAKPEFAHANGLGGDLQIYRKNILLLFGEYIPGSETFTFLKTAFPQVGNFGRGVGPDVLRIVNSDPSKPDIPVGPIICYEALFPNYIIGAARKGSQMILNITNDSWFGPFGEPILHFSLVTFRSIEARLPQLRSTNTGISALILPDGTVEPQTKIGTEEIMNVRVPLTDPIPTLMKKWGDWFGPFALVFGVFLVMVEIFLLPRPKSGG
jgi:apolipoprotein N-acyltransferase